jgi:uncharacterized protein (TIGR02646 family)
VRTIEKGMEPACLAGLRREALRVERDTGKPPTGADWDPRDCGEPIRMALCYEQQGLCAYCMRRIRPRGDGMKIEHFVARSDDPRRMYDWDNLLGVCDGVIRGGSEGEIFTCDTARGDRPLHINPAKPPPKPEDMFIIGKSGRIDVEGDDAKSDRETLNLNHPPPVAGRQAELKDPRELLRSNAKADRKTLNLNHPRLVARRRAVIEDLRKRLRSNDDIKAIRRLLQIFSTPTRDGLPEYARVAVEYLQRKLRARGA